MTNYPLKSNCETGVYDSEWNKRIKINAYGYDMKEEEKKKRIWNWFNDFLF